MEWSLARRIEGFFFFLFVLLHHANHSIPLFVYHLPITFPLPACMILLTELGVCFSFFIGLVRSGLGLYCLCFVSA